LMGFHIPQNFNLPYFASSPVDFWKRWHISLSGWLRDYLYISLGGNRTGHRNRNVMITMLLGGLWHGAAWTFVAWGAWHGVIIVITHWLNDSALGRWVKHGNWLVRLLKMALTFYLVVIGWVLFRAKGFDHAWHMLTQMHGASTTAPAGDAGAVMILVVAALVFMHGMDALRIRYAEAIEARLWLLVPLLVLGFFITLLIGDAGHDFIYFQF